MTVVAVEQAVAVPFATRQLADLGARVIKIERPDGGDFARSYDTTVKGLSSYFVWLNRSKESLTLDLKVPALQPVLDRLLGRADVFIHNLAPGAIDRLGLSTAGLRARDPRLIVCAVTGYGSSGPYVGRKAYDLLVQGETGAIAVTGTPTDPSKVGISIADIAAGMYAYSGILAALLARARSGQGTTVEVSLFDALGEWMSAPAYYTRYGGSAPARSGANHASIAPYGPFKTAGGQTVLLGIQNAREWNRFCDLVLERPELTEDQRFRTNPLRVAHRDELALEIARVFRTLPADQVRSRLDAAGIAHARLNDIADFADHPQLTSRGRWASVDSAAGPIDLLRPPTLFDRLEPVMGPIPAVGEHTDAILQELEFDKATVADWRGRGFI